MATAATAWPTSAGPSSHHAAAAQYSCSQSANAAQSSRRSSHASNNDEAERQKRHQQQQQQQHYEDRFYGHRNIAELCERVIFALFSCPLDSASTAANGTTSSVRPAPRLSEFIAYALHRTRLPTVVTHHALFLLKRLKSRFPAARGSSGHRLFISALMLASKVECDDTYSNKSWTIVGQGLFSLSEINQMERELFGYLGFRVNVQNEELQEFVAGLAQGRINAPPMQPPSPAMGVDALPAVPVTSPVPAPARRMVSSPSQSADAVYTQPDVPAATVLRGRHLSANGFSTRASISGYPSMASSVPMAASTSDPTLHRGHQYIGPVASVPHRQDVRSPVPPPNHFRSVVAAPSVPMQGYCAPSSPAEFYSSPMSRSTTNDAYSYIPSPFASRSSAASSSHTSPETPGSELSSPNWNPTAASVRHGDEDLYQEKPAGTYDREHQAFARHLQHRQPATQYRPHTGGSSALKHAYPQHYQQQPQQQQQRDSSAWH